MGRDPQAAERPTAGPNRNTWGTGCDRVLGWSGNLTRRVYVGVSAPIGYDYSTEVSADEFLGTGYSGPNPVLENVMGLLLCYDEIWFPTEATCPRDMRELPYVKFISDDPVLLDRAALASEQYRRFERAEWGIDYRSDYNYVGVTQQIVDAVNFEMLLDNHGRPDEHFGTGNAGDPELFLSDVGVARSLDMPIELVVNTRLSSTAEQLSALGVGSTYGAVALGVAENVALVRTIDYLGQDGAYHESVEDLRSHRLVDEFRTHLAALDADKKDAIQLAREVNTLADRHAANIMEKYLHGRGKLYSICSTALGPLGNLLAPGVGTAAKHAVKANEWRENRQDRATTSWALFVLQARDLGARRAE